MSFIKHTAHSPSFLNCSNNTQFQTRTNNLLEAKNNLLQHLSTTIHHLYLGSREREGWQSSGGLTKQQISDGEYSNTHTNDVSFLINENLKRITVSKANDTL